MKKIEREYPELARTCEFQVERVNDKEKKPMAAQKNLEKQGLGTRTLLEGHAKSEFYKHFMAKIRDISTEYFGSKETTRVLKALETSKIQIPSIEIFLFDSSDINDQVIAAIQYL